MHIKPPTLRDMLSLELVTSSPSKKSRTTFGSLVNDSKRMRSKHVQMRLEVEEEKNLMQQICRVALRKNLNPTKIK
jgi:hypothetical protein